VIKGEVLEHIPFKTIKIQTFDGSTLIYNTYECDSIKKEYSYTAQENAQIRKKTAPLKFSKNCYYNLIIESATFVGKSTFERYYYEESDDIIFFSGVNIINGLQVHKNYFIGIGTGLNFHLYDKVIEPDFYLSMPLFLDLRYFISSKKSQPFINICAGSVLPVSFMTDTDNPFYYFVNPSLGAKTMINARNAINLSLGYSFLFGRQTLQTYNMGNNLHYDYMDHNVYNQINGINLKIGFTF